MERGPLDKGKKPANRSRRAGLRRFTKVAALSLVGVLGLGFVLPVSAAEEDGQTAYAESLQPITLGNGAGEVGVREALNEIAARTGWTVVVDGRVALEGATIPAEHPSLWVCLNRIAEAVGLRYQWGARLALLRPRLTGSYPEYQDVCSHLEWAREAVHRSGSVLEVIQSLTPTQRDRLTQPPHGLAWGDLTPGQQNQVSDLLGSPWAREGLSLEEVADGLTILAGARVVVCWKIGSCRPEVTLRATSGCPVPKQDEFRSPQPPPHPVTLPQRDEAVYTLGEIVQAVADQTDREFYAEPEVAELPIRFFTQEETFSDETLLRLSQEMAWGVWQRVGEVELLSQPDLSLLVALHTEEKSHILRNGFNDQFRGELETWLPVADLPLPVESRVRDRAWEGHRLGDLTVPLQEELIQALRRGVSDVMRQVIGERFMRADYLADSRVKFKAQLLLGFAHAQHGRRFYASYLLYYPPS